VAPPFCASTAFNTSNRLPIQLRAANVSRDSCSAIWHASVGGVMRRAVLLVLGLAVANWHNADIDADAEHVRF